MKQISISIIVLFCILLFAFRYEPLGNDSGISKNNNEAFCRLEGSYIIEPAEGIAPYSLDMAVSLDEKNNRVTLINDVANYDATFGGLFPTAVRLTTGHGEAVRTGSRTFDYTLYFWGLDRNNQRVSILVSSGTKVFSEGDCNIYKTVGGALSIYTLDQDADKDGYPDKGQLPKYCKPFTCKAKRVTVLPPCK